MARSGGEDEFSKEVTSFSLNENIGLLKSSSVVEIPQPRFLDLDCSTNKRLGHCITLPIGSDTDVLVDRRGIGISKSMTEKKCISSGIKFDKLSEREKKKLIADLVRFQKDGTVKVDLDKGLPIASDFLQLQDVEREPFIADDSLFRVPKSLPRLEVALLVVGTRGDVQPFLAMAKRLKEFGHSVRLATHANFRGFVKSAGIEFYPLGGDPRVLTGYMVRNKGLIPSGPGEIAIQSKQLKAIIESLLPACTEPDLESGRPFRAQAIIANPPAYGHSHVAEALGVPIHIFFTMPWTPTSSFPHPLARVPQSAGYWLSYLIVDFLIWWGIRGHVNSFRKRKLKLAPVAYFSMYHGSITHLPTGYMWSSHVVPKPNDWGDLVDVVGYCFLTTATSYTPIEELSTWLQNGPMPIYIGFGSMPLEDPQKITQIILDALKNTKQRGIIDKGWGDLGNFSEVPENVFLLEDCPHDWLFPRCSAVVHHGGAGTTATGLRAGCPTTVVPFFGDQFFWGDRIYQKGLGPEPIPISSLTVEALSYSISFMLHPEVKCRAMEMARLIENEDGVAAAVNAFHRHLPPEMPLPSPALKVEEEEEEEYCFLEWLFSKVCRFCSTPSCFL